MSVSLDTVDFKILSLLQQDARLSNAELARQLGMAPSAVLERVRKLEQNEVISSFHTRINPDALQLSLLAFVFVKSGDGPGNISVAKQLARIPEVQELHHVAGEDCYLAKVRARNPQALIKLMREKFGKIPGLLSTKTTIVLETVKEDNFLPVPQKAD